MVITGIIGMTAGAVVIVVETATAEAGVETEGPVAVVEIEGQVVAEVVADKVTRPMRQAALIR